jgi:hypothetical protein
MEDKLFVTVDYDVEFVLLPAGRLKRLAELSRLG